MKNKKALIIVISLIVAMVILGVSFGFCYMVLELKRNSEGFVPTAEQLASSTRYERVIIIGVDGAGNHFKDIDTPNFDKMFGGGSINFEALTQFQADSAPNWCAMLHGVKYIKHRVHNGDSGKKPYTNDKYPSIFKIAHESNPEINGLSISNWPNINIGIIENLDYVTKISTGNDDRVVEEFKNNFLSVDPKITFLCLDDCDAAGHSFGVGEEYYDAIKKSDARIGEIYDFLQANGKIDGTLFIFAADHGHKKSGGHGFTFPVENKDVITTTIAVNGNLGNVIQNGKMGKAVTHDVASIALFALGIKQPSNFDGKVPYGIFSDLQ